MIESDNDNDNDATVATAAAMAGSTPAATATTTTTAWWSTVTTTSTTSTIAVRAPAAAAANKPPLPPPSLAPTPDAAVAVLVQPEKETSSSSSSSFSSSWSPPSPSSPSSAGSSFLDSDSAPSTPTTLSPSPPSHQKPVPKFPSPSPHSRKSGRAASHLVHRPRRRTLFCAAGFFAFLSSSYLAYIFFVSVVTHDGHPAHKESTPSSPPTPTLPPASVPVIPPLDEDALRQREKWLRFLDTPQPYDGDHGRTVRGSRGIVYTGTDATVKHLLVSVLFLRDFGCSLPIEFVYVGSQLSKANADLIRSYNVSLVDMQEDLKNVDWGPEEWKFGAAKVSAIIHSTFQEVLFMDPDNMVMRDPTYLFSTNRFKTYGALFWPDYFRRKKDIPMWEIFDIPLGDRGKDELEFESGQIVVDKERAWNGLKAAEFISSEAKYYFKYFIGDKEAIHWGFRATKTPYFLNPYYLHAVGVISSSSSNWEVALEVPKLGSKRQIPQHTIFCGLSMLQHDFYDGPEDPSFAASPEYLDRDATHPAALHTPSPLFMHGNGIKTVFIWPSTSMRTMRPFQVARTYEFADTHKTWGVQVGGPVHWRWAANPHGLLHCFDINLANMNGKMIARTWDWEKANPGQTERFVRLYKQVFG